MADLTLVQIAAEAVLLMDKLVAEMLTLQPSLYAATGVATVTSSTTPGFGDNSIAEGAGTDYGAQLKARDWSALIRTPVGANTDADATLLNALNKAASDAVTAAPLQKKLSGQFSARLTALNNWAKAAMALQSVTVANLAGLQTYFNIGIGGPWKCLAPPDWRTLIFNNGGVYPLVTNVYAPPISTTVNANGLGKLVTPSTFTVGVPVDSTKFAGIALPSLLISGYVAGPGNMIITGTAIDASGAAQTGRTWTVAGSNPITANGTYPLVPTIAGDLLVSVTGMSMTGLGATTVGIVLGAIPAGRTYPPL